jgi:hypothetical protein
MVNHARKDYAVVCESHKIFREAFQQLTTALIIIANYSTSLPHFRHFIGKSNNPCNTAFKFINTLFQAFYLESEAG